MIAPSILHIDDLAYDYTQIADANTRTLAQRAAEEIKPRLRRATEDILVIGQRLAVVREYLPHGQWLAWLTAEFEMADDSARRFINVATRFADKSRNLRDLKPSALYMLAAPNTPDEAIAEVESLITNGHTPTVAETKQIITEVRAGTRPARAGSELPRWRCLRCKYEKEGKTAGDCPQCGAGSWVGVIPPTTSAEPVEAPTDNVELSPDPRARRIAQAQSLPPKTYNVILADPPWQYNNTGLNGAAANHYTTMSLSQLNALPDQIGLDIAPNAVLFLWATNPLLVDALDLVHMWGFTYKTNIVWVKDRIGTGFYVRGMHELLLICTRGAMTPIDTGHVPPITSVLHAPTQEHSRKPDQIHTLIEKLYPNCNYIELFARRPRDGWDVWGNEVNQ